MTSYPLSTYQVSVGGTFVPILQGSLNIDLAIARRSTCSFDVEDLDGAWHFKQGQQILLYDALGVLVFGGFVQKAREKKVSYGGARIHSISGMDYHYLADKRIVASSYLSTTTDTIVNDLVTNYLAAEGVVTSPANANLLSTNQAGVGTDTTGFNAINGATISRDTTKAWIGDASLKIVADGTQPYSGIQVTLPVGSYVASTTYTASFYVQAPAGMTLYATWWNDTLGNVGGNITLTATGAWQRVAINYTTGASLSGTVLGFEVFTSATESGTYWFDGAQIELGSSATPWQLPGTPASVATGGSLTEIIFNYETAASALDKLATQDGYWWMVDERKILWYQPYAAISAPWVCDGTMAEYALTYADISNAEYRNRQWVVGGKDKTSLQTNDFKGDGQNRNFTCAYQLAQVPTITLNGVAQTVGIKGVDTGKQWYFSKDDAVIAQDTGGTVLTATDTLSVQFIGEYPVVALSADSVQVSTEQGLEGGGTGYVESKYENAQISSATAAFEVANALIAKYGQALTTLTLGTLKSGLKPGQLLTVNLSDFALSNKSMLVQSVNISDADGYNIWYTVSCVTGPHNADNWQTFWTKLLARDTVAVNQSSSGSSQIVALTDTETLTINLTLTQNTTIYACPVPSPTLYPSSTLYPC